MKLSLRSKYAIILTSIIGVVIFLLTFGALSAYNQIHSSLKDSINKDVTQALHQQVAQRAETFTNVLTEELLNPLYYYDLDAIYSILKAIRSEPNMIEALVLDSECRILHDGREEIPQFRKPFTKIEHCSKELVASKKSIVTTDDKYLYASKPILFDDQIIGSLFITLSLAETNEAIRQLQNQFSMRKEKAVNEFFRNTILLSVAIGLLSLIIAAILAARLIRPIDRLKQHAARIGKGDYSTPVDVNAGEDLRDLADAFEQMRVDLSSSTVSIEKLQFEIEDRIEAEKQRDAIEQQLRQAQRMEGIGQLASGIAHDLNNILSGIVTLPQMLLHNLPEDSPLKASLQTIEKSGNHAATIVQDMLTLAKGGTSIEEVLSLRNLVTSYLNSPECMGLQDTHPGVNVEPIIPNKSFNIKGSPVHLTKVLMNLVNNAGDAIEGRGTITIKLTELNLDIQIGTFDSIPPGNYACLSVEDTGVGISDDEISRVFEPFYTKKVMGRNGTGLGMVIVWNSVKDHNGYIDIESTPQSGTKITLYFPLTDELPADNCSFSPDPIPQRGSGETILVVDDIPAQRDIASTILTSMNYTTVTVESGAKAIEYIKDHHVDMVLMDMIMDPGINGLEATQQILEIKPDTPILIASGYSETGMIEKAIQCGARQFIQKPYSIKALGDRVRDLLSDQRK